MTPVTVSGARSSRLSALADMVRDYAVPSYSTAKRNTFTGSTVGVHPPAIDFASAGAAAETNKLFEMPVEVTEPSNTTGCRLGGPGHTIDWDFPQLFSCNHTGGLANPADAANVDAVGWTGIELQSCESNTLTNHPTPGNGWVTLRRSIKDPKNFSLQVRNTNGGQYPQGKVDFTVPFLPSSVTAGINPLTPDNLCIGLLWDPWGPYIYALVNGSVAASLGIAYGPGGSFVSGNMINCGLVVWSGAQTGAAKIVSQWSGIRVTTFGTNAIGAGI